MKALILVLAILVPMTTVPTVVAQVAPIELQAGEMISISCAPAPPACPDVCGDDTCDSGEDQCSCSTDCGLPPSGETGLCTDGVDNDCDDAIDCADSDCSADPACEGSEPVEAWVRIRFDDVHAVDEDGVDISMNGPAPPGSFVHHFNDLSGNNREFTQFDPRWWAEIAVGGEEVAFSPTPGEFDQYMINPNTEMTLGGDMFDVPRGSSWMIEYVGAFHAPTSGWIGTDGSCPGTKYNLGMDWYVPSSGGGAAITTNLEGSGDVTLMSPQPIQHTRVGLVITKHTWGTYDVWQKEACSSEWLNVASGVIFDRRVCWNVFPAYYPGGLNGTDNYTTPMDFREFSMVEGDIFAEQAKVYLDAEHRSWIDQGCQQ